MSKTMRNLLIGISAVLCLLGVVLILWPLTYRQIVVYFCGAVLAVFGVIRVILYFAKSGQPGFRFSLSGGILAIIAAVLFFVRADTIVGLFGLVVAISIIIESIVRLQLAIDIKRLGGSWLFGLVSSLVMLAAGIFLIFDPIASAAVATIVSGVALIVEGVSNIVVVIRASRILKNTIETTDYRVL